MPNKPVKQQNLMFSMSQDGKKTGSNNAAFYFESSALCKITELVKYGDLHISKTHEGLMIQIADYPPVEVILGLQKTMIVMANISTLLPGAAAMMAKIAEAFLYLDDQKRFKINAYDKHAEKQMWQAATELKLSIEANNSDQRKLFSEWAKQYGQQQLHKSKALFRNNLPLADDNMTSDNDTTPNDQL
ncbi:MAG: hypothetical protein Q7V63_04995 [Gammaproteobacteria bacterium]|nr:hypothetical protein [Gammaproteobacteria bacterium]